MTVKDRDSARVRLMQIVQEVKASYGYRRADAIKAIAKRFEKSGDRSKALLIAAEALYGERERLGRKNGLRPGYSVQRNGQIYSLALLDQMFREARVSVRRELNHAHNSLSQAEWDRYLLGVCEERAREQGYDPDETELVLSHFVDGDEAVALHRDWHLRRAA